MWKYPITNKCGREVDLKDKYKWWKKWFLIEYTILALGEFIIKMNIFVEMWNIDSILGTK